MRYFLRIGYDGGGYHGWQAQPGGVATVQQVLEGALSTILRRPVAVVGAGRTDTGVHALNMAAHLDLREGEAEGLLQRLQCLLPPTIAAYSLTPVVAHASARYDARLRTYHYYVEHRRDPWRRRLGLWLPRTPDYERMNEAAHLMLGTRDFTSLSRTHTQTHTNLCTLTHARWHPRDDGGWTFVITADRFLRGMVRATVGTLLDVGRGKLPPEAVLDILEARDRRRAGQAVPPHALYLAQIDYPYYHEAMDTRLSPFVTPLG